MMRRAFVAALGALVAALGVACTTANPAMDAGACAEPRTTRLRVAVYRKETLWFHTSNPLASQALDRIGTERKWDIDTLEPGDMTPTRLEETDVVVLLLPSGDALSEASISAFDDYVRRGGGVVGVHSASYTEPSRAALSDILGAKFRTHGAIIPLTVRRVGASKLNDGLPASWTRTDEWYSFDRQPADGPGLEVLYELVEPEGYPADLAMGRHPIAWTRMHGSGRVFYTAMGHTDESYTEAAFLQHLVQGIEWAGAPRSAKRARCSL